VLQRASIVLFPPLADRAMEAYGAGIISEQTLPVGALEQDRHPSNVNGIQDDSSARIATDNISPTRDILSQTTKLFAVNY